jgi:hypothetical protein
MATSGIAGIIYESCASDCSGAEDPRIVMGWLLGFRATEEFYNLF